MIPIAISSSEAQYIRKLLRSQQKGKNVKRNFSDNHLRHPRKINKSDVANFYIVLLMDPLLYNAMAL